MTLWRPLTDTPNVVRFLRSFILMLRMSLQESELLHPQCSTTFQFYWYESKNFSAVFVLFSSRRFSSRNALSLDRRVEKGPTPPSPHSLADDVQRRDCTRTMCLLKLFISLARLHTRWPLLSRWEDQPPHQTTMGEGAVRLWGESPPGTPNDVVVALLCVCLSERPSAAGVGLQTGLCLFLLLLLLLLEATASVCVCSVVDTLRSAASYFDGVLLWASAAVTGVRLDVNECKFNLVSQKSPALNNFKQIHRPQASIFYIELCIRYADTIAANRSRGTQRRCLSWRQTLQEIAAAQRNSEP